MCFGSSARRRTSAASPRRRPSRSCCSGFAITSAIPSTRSSPIARARCINGIVQRADSRAVIVELGKAEAVMPAREQVPTERYRPGQRVKVYLLEVNKDPNAVRN